METDPSKAVEEEEEDEDEEEELLVEEREAEMLSFLNPNQKPTNRKAWFLRSTIATGTHHNPPFVPLNHKSPSFLSLDEPKAQFKGWSSTPRQWEQWIAKLRPTYSGIWKKVGIFDAILSSVYRIKRDPSSIFGLISFWCEETNTFLFPWGEATITLEDIIILSGFSVLGEPVRAPLPDEWRDMEVLLTEQRLRFNRSTSKKAHHSAWIKEFIEREGDDLEHVAFLSLWISRFVFSCPPEMTIRQHVFPIAIKLARGQRIALAPSVLASIYRDLTELKRSMVTGSSGSKDSNLMVWGPLHIFQIWIWERFPGLRPEAQSPVRPDEPRAARWHEAGNRKLDPVLVRSILVRPDGFQFRPYAINSSNWYKNNTGELVRDEELRSFAQCLRVCELVGLDTIEQYLPNRVGMQFGFDLDLPGSFTRVNISGWEMAWGTYEITADNIGIYVPPQPFEPGVTVNYSKWWNEYMLACCGVDLGLDEVRERRERSKSRSSRDRSKKARVLDSVSVSADKKRNLQDFYDNNLSDWVVCKKRNFVGKRESERVERESVVCEEGVREKVGGENENGEKGGLMEMERVNGEKEERTMEVVMEAAVKESTGVVVEKVEESVDKSECSGNVQMIIEAKEDLVNEQEKVTVEATKKKEELGGPPSDKPTVVESETAGSTKIDAGKKKDDENAPLSVQPVDSTKINAEKEKNDVNAPLSLQPVNSREIDAGKGKNDKDAPLSLQPVDSTKSDAGKEKNDDNGPLSLQPADSTEIDASVEQKILEKGKEGENEGKVIERVSEREEGSSVACLDLKAGQEMEGGQEKEVIEDDTESGQVGMDIKAGVEMEGWEEKGAMENVTEGGMVACTDLKEGLEIKGGESKEVPERERGGVVVVAGTEVKAGQEMEGGEEKEILERKEFKAEEEMEGGGSKEEMKIGREEEASAGMGIKAGQEMEVGRSTEGMEIDREKVVVDTDLKAGPEMERGGSKGEMDLKAVGTALKAGEEMEGREGEEAMKIDGEEAAVVGTDIEAGHGTEGGGEEQAMERDAEQVTASGDIKSEQEMEGGGSKEVTERESTDLEAEREMEGGEGMQVMEREKEEVLVDDKKISTEEEKAERDKSSDLIESKLEKNIKIIEDIKEVNNNSNSNKTTLHEVGIEKEEKVEREEEREKKETLNPNLVQEQVGASSNETITEISRERNEEREGSRAPPASAPERRILIRANTEENTRRNMGYSTHNRACHTNNITERVVVMDEMTKYRKMEETKAMRAAKEGELEMQIRKLKEEVVVMESRVMDLESITDI